MNIAYPSNKLPDKTNGFTLVEIMIVVVIIGLLAAIAIPAFQKVRENTVATRIASDFRVFIHAFEQIALEEGAWPPDGIGAEVPLLAENYFSEEKWANGPVQGSSWDYEGSGRYGMEASIRFEDGAGNAGVRVMERVDAILDDGDLSTGLFRTVADGYLYILEF